MGFAFASPIFYTGGYPLSGSLMHLVFAVFLLVFAGFPLPADAYIDPGTGSFMVQMLFGAAVSGLVAVKMAWGRIRETACRLFKRPPDA